jgi:predicted restriction endonuclease
MPERRSAIQRMTRPDYWLTKFSHLRIDRARGHRAPHKPLLLLVLCDLVEKENLRNAILTLSPELAFRFYTYWSIVAGRRPQRPDCAAQRDMRAPACHAVILSPSLSF